MKKYKCIIVDDEKPARRLIENYCNRIDDIDLIGSYKSPVEIISILENNTIDIIFLDIRMPEISGLDFIKTIKSKPYIILTTAYREHAIEAFELDVIDYLLKPIEFPRFLKAINKIKSYHSILYTQHDYKKQNSELEYITLKSNKKTYKIKTDDIILIESDNEYIKYLSKTHGKLIVYGSLKNAIDILPLNFCRIHRSFIVNCNHILYVEGNRISILDVFLTIGESYRKSFFEEWRT